MIAFLFTTIVDSVLILSVGRIDGIVDTIAAIFLFVMMYIAVLFVTMLYLHSFLDSLEHKSPSLINKIKEKTLSTDYMLNSNIIDCPMKVKKELFNDLVDSKYLYISYDKKENILKFYKDNSNEVLHEHNLNERKNFTEKDSLEYQYWYLAKQLEDGKFYRISDIITDIAVKEKNVYE